MTSDKPAPDRAGAYRRLVDFRSDMLALGYRRFTRALADLYYPAGLAQFDADAATIVEANREAEERGK